MTTNEHFGKGKVKKILEGEEMTSRRDAEAATRAAPAKRSCNRLRRGE